ncbi:MAG TPA: DUF488 family protein [Tepidisphaeraceae bacterium]|jgi:uncharacterized protein YeaO (DUF488 family)
MISVKNLFDAVETTDGQRIWVESHGLTSDLQEWCKIDALACHFGPSPRLTEWFEEHPDGYEHFRGNYHAMLAVSRFLPLLQQLAQAAQNSNVTLVHQSDDPGQNTGTALFEFLIELQAYFPPQEQNG